MTWKTIAHQCLAFWLQTQVVVLESCSSLRAQIFICVTVSYVNHWLLLILFASGSVLRSPSEQRASTSFAEEVVLPYKYISTYILILKYDFYKIYKWITCRVCVWLQANMFLMHSCSKSNWSGKLLVTLLDHVWFWFLSVILSNLWIGRH